MQTELISTESCLATLEGQKIILGITGGIAAYKGCELVRGLKAAGAFVRVVMTRAACQFVQPLTFEALSGEAVATELFGPGETAMAHIDLARWADRIVVAPASADFMARLAHGMADDLLCTLCLAFTGKLTLAPSMNQAMWLNPATQMNLMTLQSRGVEILMPANGRQACGDFGPGRLIEPQEIIESLRGSSVLGALSGTRVLVTAGPTREPLDPVRCLTNRSSGRMGFEIAKAAARQGADVTLVHGPTSLRPPHEVVSVSVETAEDMAVAVLKAVGNIDVFIATAAVADYAPVPEPQKIKKSKAEITLRLRRTRDILAEVSSLENRPFCVGFAAETEQLEHHALKKLTQKHLDLVAANLVGPDRGFDSEDNELTVFWKGGQEHLGFASKMVLADRLIQIIAKNYNEIRSTQDS